MGGMSMILAALLVTATMASADEKPSGDTTVYHVPGKKRVHVKECRRLKTTEGTTKMTLAEAEAKGLPLCSRCPGSTTQGKGNPDGEDKDKPNDDAKPGDDGKLPGDTKVYHTPGKKRVHVKGCRRLETTEGMTEMTLAEAEAKGLPLCSKCPGSTTDRDDKDKDKGEDKDEDTDKDKDEANGDKTKLPGDTVVYYFGKKRVHVEGCRRLTTKEGATKMTLAEAEAKGLALCSRCPGSTTPGKKKEE
jgi:uncharacterized protein YodC (DUF2158 family)